MIRNGILVLAASFLFLGGCASNNGAQQEHLDNQVSEDEYVDERDPLEGFNRAMWDFNYDVLDKHLLRPAAVTYVEYTPKFARTGLYNFAKNLEEPSNSVNNLLQGKVGGSMTSLGRFVLNSTVGLLGTIDVADKIGLPAKEEEFGEVLGKYGVGTGAYLMLPALGPSDIRSTVGGIVDSAYFPLQDLNTPVSILRVGIKALEGRAGLLKQEEQLKAAFDQYGFVKDAYFQNLSFKVNDGLVEDDEKEYDEELDDLLDDL